MSVRHVSFAPVSYLRIVFPNDETEEHHQSLLYPANRSVQNVFDRNGYLSLGAFEYLRDAEAVQYLWYLLKERSNVSLFSNNDVYSFYRTLQACLVLLEHPEIETEESIKNFRCNSALKKAVSRMVKLYESVLNERQIIARL